MDRFVLYAFLDRFYVTALERRTPELAQDPLIVSHQKLVLDANDKARAAGVVRGIPVTRARTLMGSAGVVRPWKAEEYEELQKKWLDICADHSGQIQPEAQHAAHIDLSLHPDPIYVAVHLVDRLAEETGNPIRYGVGTTKWIARAAALVEGARFAPLRPDELAELKVEFLAPMSPEDCERLRFLGYRRIGDVLRVPLHILREQFGEEGHRIHQAVRGTLADPVKAVYPPDALRECLIFDGEVDSSLVVQEAIQEMAFRIAQRLQIKNAQATEVVGEIHDADRNVQRLKRSFGKPLRCPRSAHAALSLLFTQQLKDPVHALAVTLPKLEPVRCVQAELMQAQKQAPRIDSALSQVRAVFGESAIQSAAEVVLPRRQRVLKEWQSANGWH